MRRANAPVRAMATVSHKGGGDKTLRENWSWALDFGMVRNQPRIMGPSGGINPSRVRRGRRPPVALGPTQSGNWKSLHLAEQPPHEVVFGKQPDKFLNRRPGFPKSLEIDVTQRQHLRSRGLYGAAFTPCRRMSDDSPSLPDSIKSSARSS